MKQKIVIFGGHGLVGTRFRELVGDSLDMVAPTIDDLDILDVPKLKKFLDENPSEIILNFAAFTNVAAAEGEKENLEGLVYKLNALAVKQFAQICQDLDRHFVQISTEYVFDGTKEDSSYTEEDDPHPINWYGKTKYLGEKFLQESGCHYSIVRISMPFSAKFADKGDIARFYLQQLEAGQEVKAIIDAKNTPVLVDDIANGLKAVIDRKFPGIIHVTSKDSITPFDFATLLAEEFGLDKNLIKPVSFEEFGKERKAPLLKNSWLSSQKFRREFGEGILHTVEENVKIFKQQIDSLS